MKLAVVTVAEEVRADVVEVAWLTSQILAVLEASHKEGAERTALTDVVEGNALKP